MARKCPTCGQSINQEPDRYEMDVAFALKTLRARGKIWEGARPAFESGEYYDPSLARMLDEGIIVPSANPEGGYVLPVAAKRELAS